jgi:hypothetical protein
MKATDIMLSEKFMNWDTITGPDSCAILLIQGRQAGGMQCGRIKWASLNVEQGGGRCAVMPHRRSHQLATHRHASCRYRFQPSSSDSVAMVNLLTAL